METDEVEGQVEKNPYIDEEEDYYSDDDLYNITSWGSDLSFRELITLYEDGDLIKPEIQRKYIWDKSEASRFIESLLMGLPVPSIFLATQRESRIIVDGYQRIMSVHDYVKGIWSKNNTVFSLSNTDKINKRWRGKSFNQLEKREQKRILIYSIHAIVFEQREPKESSTSLYQIFERINSGGQTLKPQEIRNCIYQGPFNSLLIELNRDDNWRVLWGSQEEHDRMKDIEFILRFFALNDEKYVWSKSSGQISLKKHLNKFMGNKKSWDNETLNKRKTDFIKAMEFIHDHLGANAFHGLITRDDGSTYISKTVQATLIDSISIATLRALESGEPINTDDLEEKRLKLLQDESFIEYSTIRTTNIIHIKGRVNLAMKYLYGIEADND